MCAKVSGYVEFLRCATKRFFVQPQFHLINSRRSLVHVANVGSSIGERGRVSQSGCIK